jgi:DNA-binding NtrC family response regulator
MNPVPNQENATATILVVEDNSSARMALEALLDALDYKVVVAADPAEALDVFATRQDSIELVISDLILPQLSGPELYDRLREIKPGLRCIIMSGYPLEDESTRLLQHGIHHWIQKPFNMRQLLEMLQTALQD